MTLQAPDGFPLQSLGMVDQVRKSEAYSTKLTWQINPANRLDASFFGDPSTGDMGPQRLSALLVTDTSSFSSLKYGGHNQTVELPRRAQQPLAGRGWLRRALNRLAETPLVDAWRVADQTITPTVTTGGIGFYEAQNRSVNNQYPGR